MYKNKRISKENVRFLKLWKYYPLSFDGVLCHARQSSCHGNCATKDLKSLCHPDHSWITYCIFTLLTTTEIDVLFSWVPECAKVLLDSKHHWTHLIPVNEGDSTTLIQKFFSCVAALMSIQLRSLVLNSLKDFLQFLKMYEVSKYCLSDICSFLSGSARVRPLIFRLDVV